MGAREFAGWQYFYSRHPFGFYRDDYRAAKHTQHMLAMFSGEGKEPPKVEDLLLRFEGVEARELQRENNGGEEGVNDIIRQAERRLRAQALLRVAEQVYMNRRAKGNGNA